MTKPLDPRPQKGGWIPSPDYFCRCHLCGCQFIGYKRAFECADCAYSIPERPGSDYPRVTLGGVSYDLYDVASAAGVRSHALFNALKKIIRSGAGAKSERKDLEEAIQSIQRHLRDLPPTLIEAITQG